MTRKWPLVVGGALLTVAVGWWVLQVALLDSPDRGNAATYGQFVLAAAGLLISLAALWKTLAPNRVELGLDELTDRLALAMRNQWTNAANERRLLQPAPLPIRWHRSGDPVAGPPAAATHAGHGFDPLPGLDRVTNSRLRQGTRRDLHRVYGGLASGRLLIVGGPGTGKSSAAILLLLDALRYRDQASAEDRARIPVPVLFTLHGWNPEATPVEAWLCKKLAGLPVLRGRDAATLLQAGRIAVFLDGLDEIPEPVRPLALQALSEQATFRLVLLTRTPELADAARHHGLTGAVALQLDTLKPADVADYLLRPLVEPVPPAWQKLTAALMNDPDGALAQSLTIPLGVSLLRDIYTPGTPVDELCDTQRFPGAEDISDHLLDQAIDAAYTPRPGQPAPRYTAETAHRVLTFIARRLNQTQTRDLAWWAILAWLPRRKRAVRSALAGLAVGGAAAWIVYGLAGLFVTEPGRWLTGAPLVGLALGFFFGAMPARPVMAHGPVQWRRLVTFGGLWVGLVAGLVCGFLFALAYGPAVGLVIGITSAFGVAIAVNITTTVSRFAPVSPSSAWRGDMEGGLRAGLIASLALGLGFGLAAGPWGGISFGLVNGLVLGLMLPMATYTAVVWVDFALQYRMPLRLIRFLEDARSRHLLRTVGPVYQFRHATLQDRLAEA